MSQADTPVFPSPGHDHKPCLDAAVGRARMRSSAQSVAWTALRERVFREIANSHKPVSAYDLIERMAAGGKRLAPISMYRILDVLQKVGAVHRLESRNSFFACMNDHGASVPALVFHCETCDQVAETAADTGAIADALNATPFLIKTTVLEVNGICGVCARSRVPGEGHSAAGI